MQTTSSSVYLLALGCMCVVPLILAGILGLIVASMSKRNRYRDRFEHDRNDPDDRSYQTGATIGMLANTFESDSNSPNDGFWLNTSAYALGSIVDFRCRINGQPIQRSVVVQSEPKQFVYTGDKPADVQILNVAQPTATDHYNAPTPATHPPQIYPGIIPNIFDATPEETTEPPASSEPFQGYPPAY